MYLRTWFLWAAMCASAHTFKILVVFPFASQSHGILGEGVVRLLLNAGHDVTYITPFVKENTNPKLRQLDVSDNKKLIPVINITAILEKTENIFDVTKFFNITVGTFKSTVLAPSVNRLINDPSEEFDLVVVEWMFTELYSGLSAVFNCPFIWISSTDPHSDILKLIDETLNPAYNAGALTTNTPPLSFYERVQELFILGVSSVMKEYFFGSAERTEYQNLLGPAIRKRGRPVPPYEDVKFNASMVLGNSHISIGSATRLPQNYKPVGGYHIDTNVKPLPENLKQLLDNAEHGVIYFSLGSNLKSKDLPDQLKRDLLTVFSSLKETVLWKFEEEFSNLPKNVRILKWAPQPAILAHPNCILFITHGGLLSSTEAVHFGKPTIGIPVFADQFNNVERAARKGYSKRVDLSYNLGADLKAALADILGSDRQRYAKKAKELSLIYHDRPASPGAELVHWVEHVVKTKGAPHLRSPALHVPFYQKMYLDLAAVILATIMVLKMVFKYVTRSCRRKRFDSVKKNK